MYLIKNKLQNWDLIKFFVNNTSNIYADIDLT